MPVDRVTYAESQSIGLDSLTEEQAYLIAARRRHHLAHHDWGIVYGLNLQGQGTGFRLCRGIAIDGYGRELIVPEDIPITAEMLAQFSGNNIAAWLLYSRQDVDGLQYGVYRCGPGHQNRTSEQALLRLEVVATLAGIDGRNPPQVSVTNVGFGPEGDPPDDPSAVWPVFLGGLSRISSSAGWAFVAVGRPYALLRGERILAPSGSAQVQVGAETSGDRNRFAVTVAPATTPNLAIDVESNSVLRGETSIAGRLSIEPAPSASAAAGHDLCTGIESLQQRSWGVVFSPIPPPKTAEPWNIYHALVPAPQGAPVQTPKDQLRLEIFDPGTKGDRTAYGCSIGVTKGGKFIPCVTIDAECNLTINGRLTVKGSLVWGPAKPDPADPRFQAELLTTWAQGLVTNTAGIAQYYSGSMSLDLPDLDDGTVGVPIQCTLNVQNTGPFRIDNIALKETFSVAGTTASALPAPFGLDPGETKSVPRQYTCPAAGALQISVHAEGITGTNGYKVAADTQRTVQIFAKFTLAASVSTLPSDMVAGASAPYTATVTNTGAADGQVHFTRTIEVGGVSNTADLLAAGTLIHAGEAIPVAATFTPATPGNYTITAAADGHGPGHHNQASHQAQRVVRVHAPVNVAVTVTGLTDAFAGDVQNYTITVSNAGAEAVAVTDVSIAISGTSTVEHIPAFTLNHGAPNASTRSFTPLSTGTLTVTATATVTGPGKDTAQFSGSQSVTISIEEPA